MQHGLENGMVASRIACARAQNTNALKRDAHRCQALRTAGKATEDAFPFTRGILPFRQARIHQCLQSPWDGFRCACMQGFQQHRRLSQSNQRGSTSSHACVLCHRLSYYGRFHTEHIFGTHELAQTDRDGCGSKPCSQLADQTRCRASPDDSTQAGPNLLCAAVVVFHRVVIVVIVPVTRASAFAFPAF